MSYDFTFSGTTKPAGLLDVFSQIGVGAGTNDLTASTVTSGVLVEGATTTGVPDGIYWLLDLWPDPLATALQNVQMTVGNNSTANPARGQGCAVAFDSAGTNGVFCICTGAVASGQYTEAIITKVGNTFTVQASSTSASVVTSTDVVTLAMSVSAGVYTYTILKNGVATGISWTDSAHVITPGNYWGGAFQHRRSSGVQGVSRGLTRYRGADL